MYIIYRDPGQVVKPEKAITRITSAPGLEDEPTWSPDGKFMAYTSNERTNMDILIKPLGAGKPMRVGDPEADDAQPAWSPDGNRLAFVSARNHYFQKAGRYLHSGKFLSGSAQRRS